MAAKLTAVSPKLLGGISGLGDDFPGADGGLFMGVKFDFTRLTAGLFHGGLRSMRQPIETNRNASANFNVCQHQSSNNFWSKI
jgi:hypothetical protein